MDPEARAFTLVTDADGSMELMFHTLAPAWRMGPQCANIARVRYRFTVGETPAANTLERFEQFCAGEQVIANEVRDLILAGPFECGVSVLDPESSSPGESSRTSYDSQDKAPRAIRFVLQWQTEKEEPAATFDVLLPVLCDGQMQKGGSAGDPNYTARAIPGRNDNGLMRPLPT